MQFKSLFLTEVIFLNELFNKIALFSKPQFQNEGKNEKK